MVDETTGSEQSYMTRLRTLTGYGIGDFGLNIYWNTVSIWLVFWYTMVVGIEPGVAGTIFFIGMIWDSISDPIVASYAERVRSRHGTYRPFILYGSFGVAICFGFLFWVPPFSGLTLLVALIAINVVFRTSYTLVAIPYAALSARISYDSVERMEFTGVRMFFAFAGLLFVSSQFPQLIRYFSNGSEYSEQGFIIASGVGAVIATVALIFCFLGTREKPLPKSTVRARLSPSQIWQLLRENSALKILLTIIVLKSGAMACMNISLVFFIVSNQPAFASKELVLTAFAIATMAGIPLWTVFIRQIGKKRTWVFCSALIAVSGAHMLLFGPYLAYQVPVQIIVFGLCSGAFSVLLWSFIPDMVEFGQMASGKRSEGVVFGSVLVVQKLSGGFMGFVVGNVLGLIGYNKDASIQSAEVGQGLIAFLAICPALMLFLSIVPVLLLPLDRRIHADIVESLSADPAGS